MNYNEVPEFIFSLLTFFCSKDIKWTLKFMKMATVFIFFYYSD